METPIRLPIGRGGAAGARARCPIDSQPCSTVSLTARHVRAAIAGGDGHECDGRADQEHGRGFWWRADAEVVNGRQTAQLTDAGCHCPATPAVQRPRYSKWVGHRSWREATT